MYLVIFERDIFNTFGIEAFPVKLHSFSDFLSFFNVAKQKASR